MTCDNSPYLCYNTIVPGIAGTFFNNSGRFLPQAACLK